MIEKISSKYAEKIIDYLLQKAPHIFISLVVGVGSTIGYFHFRNKSLKDAEFESRVNKSLQYLIDSTAKKSDIRDLERELRFENDTNTKAIRKDIQNARRDIKINRKVLSKHIENSNISTEQKIEEIKELHDIDVKKNCDLIHSK